LDLELQEAYELDHREFCCGQTLQNGAKAFFIGLSTFAIDEYSTDKAKLRSKILAYLKDYKTIGGFIKRLPKPLRLQVEKARKLGT
jgi:hypothetical protein